MKFFTTKRITRAAVIAALYTLSTVFWIWSYGAVQFRISEALTILPLFFPEAILGLTIGCLISNFFGNGVIDIVFGTLATLVASTLTYIIGRAVRGDTRAILGIIPPILVNAIVVPFTFLALSELKTAYFISFCTVGLGQLTVLVVLGIPLYFVIKRLAKSSKYFRDEKVSDIDGKNENNDLDKY